MKKQIAICLAVLLSVALLCTVAAANAHDDANDQKTDQVQVELSQKQINKLEKIHQKVFKEKKKLISQYVKYEVISEEQGDHMIMYMQKHMEKLKENGYKLNEHYMDCPHHKKKDVQDEQERSA